MKQLGIFNLVFGSLIALLLCTPLIARAEIKLTMLPQVSSKVVQGRAVHTVQFGLTTYGVGREHNLGVALRAKNNDPALSQMQRDVDLDEGVQRIFTFTNLRPLTEYHIFMASEIPGSNGEYKIDSRIGEFITLKDSSAPTSSGNTTTGSTNNTNTSNTNNTPRTGSRAQNINQANKTSGVFQSQCISPGQCGDKIDNDRDGRADRCGLDTNNDGVLDVEPDPACFSLTADTEYKDDVESTIIPCTNKCTLRDVFTLLNNLIEFVMRNLLLPFMVVIIMYTGFRYLKAQGNPVQISGIKKTLGKIAIGILLILCSWLIVSMALKTIGYEDRILFFETKK